MRTGEEANASEGTGEEANASEGTGEEANEGLGRRLMRDQEGGIQTGTTEVTPLGSRNIGSVHNILCSLY